MNRMLMIFVAVVALGAMFGLDLLSVTDPTDLAGASAISFLPLFAGTTFKSCEGLIRIEDPAMPGTFNTVGEVTSYNLEESANIKKYFKIGTCQEQSGVTGISRTMSFEGNLDPTDAGQPDLVKIGDVVSLEVYPRGNSAGKEKWSIDGVVSSVSRNASGDDFLTFSAGVEVNVFAESIVP